MRVVILIPIISIILCSPFAAFADEKKEPVVINGDVVEYLEQGKVATATGNVVITYQDMKLTCKRAIFHIDTKEAYAEGDVVLTQGKNYFKGEHVVYNFETKTGTVLKTKAYIEPWFYGVGEKAEKVGDTEYHLRRGYITTCNKARPHYRLQSRQIKVYLGDKVTAKHILFFVENTPLLYMPYYSHPLNENRPRVTIIPGMNKEWGLFMLSAWRYYLNEDFRGRIHLDYREKKDFASGFDLFYGIPDMGKGVLRTYYMNERSLQRKRAWSRWTSPSEDKPTQEKERFRVQLRHKWQMDPLTLATIEYNKMHDPEFIRDYYERDYQRDMTNNTYASVIRTDEYFTTSFLAQKRVNRFDSVVEYLPELKFNTRTLRIGDTNFYYTGEASGANITKKFPAPTDLDNAVGRVHTDNQLAYQTTLFNWLSVKPYTGTKQTWFSRDKEGEPDVFRGNFYTGIDFNTRFYRVFDVKSNLLNMEINKLRHVIAPTITYNYTHDPTIPSSRFQQFDGVDSLGFQSVVSPSIENKLQTKRLVGGKIQAVDLVRFVVGTNYHFGFKEDKGSRLMNYNLSLESRPYNWMRILSNAVYDPHHDKFESFSFNITGDQDADLDIISLRDEIYSDIGKKKWSYGAGYRWSNDSSSQIEGEFMFNITPKWKFTTYQRFDLKKFVSKPEGGTRKVISDQAEHEYRLSRDLHCWIVELVYNVTREQGESIWLIFRLKAFPEIPFEFERNYHRPKFGSQLPPGYKK
ncbi:MAG: LPS assembly protein LptD [Candidatus Omnitrophota bacterium]